MTQVQWGTENKYRFETTLSDVSLVDKDDEKDGRFFLYPTTNIYNFILLDQIDGRAWQVQSSIEKRRQGNNSHILNLKLANLPILNLFFIFV